MITSFFNDHAPIKKTVSPKDLSKESDRSVFPPAEPVTCQTFSISPFNHKVLSPNYNSKDDQQMFHHCSGLLLVINITA